MPQQYNRKNIRLPDYDYSMPGSYFVTVCTKNRARYFGDIQGQKMVKSQFGQICEKNWKEIPKHFPNTDLNSFVVMPNHVHGIVILKENQASVGNADLRSLRMPGDRTKMLLSKIIHGFKSSVTRSINKMNIELSFGWQKSFHDHIIHNETALKNIMNYIRENPARWLDDVENNEYHIPNKKMNEIAKEYYEKLISPSQS